MSLAGIIVVFNIGYSIKCFIPHYDIREEKIYYNDSPGKKNEVSKKVDIKTFKTLDKDFAKDKNYVYFKGKIIKNIDPNTLEVLEWFDSPDPIWGYSCNPIIVLKFKDKNGEYKLEDIQTGKLKLEE